MGGRFVKVPAMAAAFVLAWAGVAVAVDNLVADGDVVASGVQGLALGSFCPDAASASGNASVKVDQANTNTTNNFANGATLTVTASITQDADGGTLSVTSPVGNITLPTDWNTPRDADKNSNALSSTVSLNPSNTAGNHSATVQYSATGNKAPTGTQTRNHDLAVTWTVLAADDPTCAPPPPTNGPPTVDAGGPYAVAEGTAAQLAATATDPDNDSLTYAWTADTSGLDVGATCTFSSTSIEDPTVTCTDDGTVTLTLTVSDPTHPPVSDTATLTVSNSAPSVGTVGLTHTAACSVSLSAPFVDAGSNDTHSASIDWGDSGTPDSVDPATSPVTGTHTYTTAGSYTVTVGVTDDDTGFGSNTGSFTAFNTPSAILAPINNTGDRSSFKIGSSIPVKITVTGCDGLPVANLTDIVVSLTKLDSSADVSVNEVASTSNPTSGTTMRWDATGAQYIYNLSTKNSQFNAGQPLTSGTYRITLSHPSFASPVTATFDARK